MRFINFMILTLLVSSTVGADTDLLTAYRRVLSSDANFLAARASAEADREELPKALAGFLPSVSFSGMRSKNESDNTSRDVFGRESTQTSKYISENYSFSLRQPIYRKQVAAQYGQAEAIAQRADISIERERQSLAVRVSQAYLDALLADDQVNLARSQKKTYISMLSQAERSFKAGVGTLTDILEIRARLDLSLAQEMEAENQVQDTLQVLQMMMDAPPGKLHRIDAKKLPTRQASGDIDLNAWITRAETASPMINALRSDLESARYELEKAKSGHYPTLDLVATRKKASNETEVSLNVDTDTTLIGLQLNVPIFAGGYVNASVRQAHAKYDQATQKLEAARREVLLIVRREFGNVDMYASKVSALEAALLSAEDAKTGTEKGMLAGTRTTIDVLNAERQVILTNLDLAKARYLFILSYLKLRDGAGGLNDEVMQNANRWLTSAPATSVENASLPQSRLSLRDDQWIRIEALCAGWVNPNGVGGRTNREFVDAVLWVAHSGSRWQDLPEQFGHWQAVYLRFTNWAKKGVWDRLAVGLKGDDELEQLFRESAVFRFPYAAATQQAGKKGIIPTKSGQANFSRALFANATALAQK